MGDTETLLPLNVQQPKSRGCTGKAFAFLSIGILSLIYVIAELAAALYLNSLALLSDGFHNLSDVVSLYIAWWAQKAAERDSDDLMSYGWARTEILGGLTNGCFLLSLSLYVALDAIPKIIRPEPIEGGLIFMIVAGAGLAINILGTVVFALTGMAHAHSHGGGGGHSHGGGGHSHGSNDEKKKKKKHGHAHDGADDHGHSHNHKDKKEKDKHGHAHASDEEKGLLVQIEDDHHDDHDHHDHDDDSHGHSHNHKEKDHGHSHNGEKKKKEHGHSHDGEKKEKKKDHGHSHDGEKKKKEKDHGHSHGDSNEDHGHSHDGEKKKKKKQAKKGCMGMDMNMFGVFIHFLGDAISSLFVLLTGALLHFTSGRWTVYVDPISSLIIVGMIVASSVPLVKRCSMILLQKVPDEIDMDKLRHKILKIQGVVSQHDLHVWQLVDGMTIASIHVGIDENVEFKSVVSRIKKIFHSQGIHSTSIQPEFVSISNDFKQDFCVQNCIESCEEEWCCKKTAERIRHRNNLFSNKVEIN